MKTLSIITGGSSGLGYAIAKQLVVQGNDVAIIGRDEGKLLDAKHNLQLLNSEPSILYYAGDITDESFVKALYSQLDTEGWIIKGLYNCAGIGRFGKPEDNNSELINITFGASLFGTIHMCTAALNVMREFGGIIVNVMSTAALKGNPNESLYCAAKWGTRGYTESLKAYLKGSNIKVIGVYPGGMNTPFWNKDCGMKPDTSKFMIPDEVAKTITDMVRDCESMYVSELVIDRK